MPNKRIFSKEEINDIINRYKDKETIASLCLKYKSCQKVINRVLKKEGIFEIRKKGYTHPEKQKFPKKDLLKIGNRFKKGEDLSEIAKEYNGTYGGLYTSLKRIGFQFGKNGFRKRKYDLDDYYFDNINTQEKAYFLGYLYADGNVSKKRNELILNLNKKDKNILLKFKRLLSSNRPLSERKKTNQFVLLINSPQIKKSLIKYGCIPCKSNILTYPSFLKPELENHFIRGYFDGDGWFKQVKSYLSKKNVLSKKGVAGIISSKNFCLEFVNKLEKMGISAKFDKKDYANGRVRVVNICGNRNVIKFMDWIYKNSTIHLDRKYKKYIRFRKWYHKHIQKVGENWVQHKKWYEDYLKTSTFSLFPLKN